MESTSSQQQELQSPSPLVIEVPVITTEVIDPAPDVLPGARFIGNSQDSMLSNVSEDMLGRICLRHGLPSDNVLSPGSNGRPHAPPEGFTAFNHHTCSAGTLPLFNQYIRKCWLSLESLFRSYIQTDTHC